MILLDGRATSTQLKSELKEKVEFLSTRGVTPGLAVIQVGEDPASSVYVRNKRRTCASLGIASFEFDLPAETTEADLLSQIDALNERDDVHGILVQLPLPEHIGSEKVIQRITPEKDVDGFHPMNAGALATGGEGFVPCTPAGVMEMLVRYNVPLSGKSAVVIGRSNIVGKPMAQLLLKANATVTITHSRTQDLAAVVRQADVVIAAVGRAELVKADWVKPGAAVVDVGIQRGADGKLVGDVAFDEVAQVAGWCSPVPGGVGPMTIAMLMANTVFSASRVASKMDL